MCITRVVKVLLFVAVCSALHVQIGNQWPDAVIKYDFDRTLLPSDFDIMTTAIRIFEKATCLNFKPNGENDSSYIFFGSANDKLSSTPVCMQTGPQNILIPNNSEGKEYQMKIVIKQIGSALCVVPEESRRDASYFIRYAPGCPKPKRNGGGTTSIGLYDFSSAFHSSCQNKCDPKPINSNIQCGQSGKPILSQFDIDSLNRLYNCRQCQRLRWVSIDQLGPQERYLIAANPIRTTDLPVFPSRSVIDGDAVSGQYNSQSNTCIIFFHGKHVLKKDYEILLLETKELDQCYAYKLTCLNENVGGLVAGFSYVDPGWVSYVVFAWPAGIFSTGFTWRNNGKITGKTTFVLDSQGVNREVSEYFTLECSLDYQCVLMHLYESFLRETISDKDLKIQE